MDKEIPKRKKIVGVKIFYLGLQNNLAIFGPFLDLQEFFKNRGLNFETLTPISVTNSASSFICHFC